MRNLLTRTIVACLTAATVAGTTGGTLTLAHAASARVVARQGGSTTFVDPTQSYALTYPASWARSARKGFDLFVQSSNKNVLVAAASVAAGDPSAGRVERDLPAFVAAVGTPLGKPTYTTYTLHGKALRVGMSGFTNAHGQAGVVVMEEASAKRRLCVVAGVVLNAAATSAKQDVTAALTILTSLQLQPNPLDAPSG